MTRPLFGSFHSSRISMISMNSAKRTFSRFEKAFSWSALEKGAGLNLNNSISCFNSIRNYSMSNFIQFKRSSNFMQFKRSFSHSAPRLATLNQVIRGCRKTYPVKGQAPALNKCPQRKGVCIKIFTVKPKKPNSAQRQVTAFWILDT